MVAAPSRGRVYHHLAFRLSLWYGAILVLLAMLCFSIFYAAMISAMRQQSDAYLLGVANHCSELLSQQGLKASLEALDREVEFAGANDVFYRVFDASGHRIASSNLSLWKDVQADVRPAPAPGTATVFENWTGTGHHSLVRVVSLRLGPSATLQLGQSVQEGQRVVHDARRIMGVAMVGMLLLAILTGWIMGRRAMSRINHLTQTVGGISHDNLAQRVEISGRNDEVDQLAQSFNGMLDRIQGLVEGMKQTNDNIAHELRSPITRMRGLAETTLAGGQSIDDYQAMAADTVEECDRLLGIINTMLDIAEAEGRVVAWSVGQVDMAEVAADACELFEPAADLKNITIQVQSNGPCLVRGNIQQLQRALANLLDNAVKYSPAGGHVAVTVSAEGGKVAVRVVNSGPGISAEDMPHIFERFYRGVEGRPMPGTGLGLSLSVAIARAHGGGITVASRPGEETVFVLRLPSSPVDPS